MPIDKALSPVIAFLIFIGCSSPTAHSANPGTVAKSKSASTRNPAQQGAGDDDDDKPKGNPPLVSSQDLWVYSWKTNPAVLAGPADYVQSEFKFAEDCISRLSKTNQPVKGCEGNGMAAGPGIYACDNPFTSHDYGSILLMLHLVKDRKTVGMATGVFTPPASSGGLDRSVTANATYEALLYDFRISDFGGRAMVLRNRNIVDLAKSQAFDLTPKTWSKFKNHPDFSCTDQTSPPDVLKNWNDQMDFMATTFSTEGDISGDGFFKDGKLNSASFAAAIASDAVAENDQLLASQVDELKKKYKAIKESMDGCIETDTATLRSCFAQRIFTSLTDSQGTPSNPTDAWDVASTKKVLIDLHIMSPAALTNVKSAGQLLKVAAHKFTSDPQQLAHVQQAFNCMLTVKKKVQAANFSQWGDDPQ